jgi:ABC-type phosphate transport system substrate-binding protein
VIVESTGTGAGIKLFCAGVGAQFPTWSTPRAR